MKSPLDWDWPCSGPPRPPPGDSDGQRHNFDSVHCRLYYLCYDFTLALGYVYGIVFMSHCMCFFPGPTTVRRHGLDIIDHNLQFGMPALTPFAI